MLIVMVIFIFMTSRCFPGIVPGGLFVIDRGGAWKSERKKFLNSTASPFNPDSADGHFLGILQNEWAGAQAFSSFDTYLAPFVRADTLSYRELKQQIQSFILE
jgi:hypothetical protein